MFSIILINILFSLNLLLAQETDSKAKETTEKTEKVEASSEVPDTKMIKFKDLIITSSYGAFAGAVIGLATLAFASHPGSKLKNVAIGASVGLYAGTLLGLYLSFAVGLPKPVDKDMDDYDQAFGYNYEDDKILVNNFNDVKIIMPVFVYDF